jgi:hypothetical protein
MATAGSVSLSGTSPNLQTGSKNIGPITMTGSTAIGAITDLVPIAGLNTITAPSTTCTAVVLAPSGCGMIAVGSSSANFPVGFAAQASGQFAVVTFTSVSNQNFNLFASSSNGIIEMSWV